MTNFKNRTVAATAAIVATLVTVASATPLRAETPTRLVRYADLDLTSKAGRTMLDRRIHLAVDAVCGYADAGNRIAQATCRSAAASAARAQIGTVAGGSVTLASR